MKTARLPRMLIRVDGIGDKYVWVAAGNKQPDNLNVTR